MEIRIIESNTTFNVNELIVSEVDADNKAQVETFLSNLSPHYEINLLDKAFICYMRNDYGINIKGLWAFSNNTIIEDENEIQYTEITHCVVDANLLDERSLSDCLKKIFPDVVNYDNKDCDEAIWFDYKHILYGRKMNSIFKTVKVYYFQNEAEYFANKIISCHLEDKRSGDGDITNKMKNTL